jgi:hypothetical protein
MVCADALSGSVDVKDCDNLTDAERETGEPCNPGQDLTTALTAGGTGLEGPDTLLPWMEMLTKICKGNKAGSKLGAAQNSAKGKAFGKAGKAMKFMDKICSFIPFFSIVPNRPGSWPTMYRPACNLYECQCIWMPLDSMRHFFWFGMKIPQIPGFF